MPKKGSDVKEKTHGSVGSRKCDRNYGERKNNEVTNPNNKNMFVLKTISIETNNGSERSKTFLSQSPKTKKVYPN